LIEKIEKSGFLFSPYSVNRICVQLFRIVSCSCFLVWTVHSWDGWGTRVREKRKNRDFPLLTLEWTWAGRDPVEVWFMTLWRFEHSCVSFSSDYFSFIVQNCPIPRAVGWIYDFCLLFRASFCVWRTLHAFISCEVCSLLIVLNVQFKFREDTRCRLPSMVSWCLTIE